MRHTRWDCKLYHLFRSPGKPFFGEASHATPQHGRQSACSLREAFESNPGPKPTLKTLLRTRTQPPYLPNILIHQSNPLNPPHPHSQAHSPPKSPTSVQSPQTPSPSSPAPTLTPYTLDLIQPTRLDSPHLLPSHKHPYAAPQHHPSQIFTSPSLPPTRAHCHTRNK